MLYHMIKVINCIGHIYIYIHVHHTVIVPFVCACVRVSVSVCVCVCVCVVKNCFFVRIPPISSRISACFELANMGRYQLQ